MSYRMIVVDGYELMEATNDKFGEDFCDLDNNNNVVVNMRDEFNKRETINAFRKILTKEIIFD